MTVEDLLLQREIENFLYAEAALIDDRRFAEWLDLLTDEFRVFVPITRNVRYDQSANEKTRECQDMAWFDEGKETISQRVAQIATGLHWAEEPRSRTVHMISNVRVGDVKSGPDGVVEATVNSAFMVYRNRGLDEKDCMVGRRADIVVRRDGEWKLKRREVDLAQSILLAKNLTTFF